MADIVSISTRDLQFGCFDIFCGDKNYKVDEWSNPCKGLIGRDEKAEILVKFLLFAKNL